MEIGYEKNEKKNALADVISKRYFKDKLHLRLAMQEIKQKCHPVPNAFRLTPLPFFASDVDFSV